MPVPTIDEIRELLEGYGITAAVLSDAWVTNCRDNEIIPHIEDITGLVFDGESEVTEYYNGTGQSTLMLNKRPVNSITSIIMVGSLTETDLTGATELIGAEGILKVKDNYSEGIWEPIFRRGIKNVKVTFKYGTDDYPVNVASAIKNLVAAKMLNHVGARTGGGALTVQAFSRNYGPHGKWTDYRKELVRTGYALLKPWMTGVVGG